jgi:hypothetical protein
MSITNNHFIRRIAETSIGISTLRGHPKNTIATTRVYLKTLKLEDFQCSNAKDFNKTLDKHTIRLSKQIKKLDYRFAFWGSARKALNIFLGNAAYHAVLRSEYRLDRIEKYLEVPLDKQVATDLISLAEERNLSLPKWKTIKGLLPENSDIYQSFASSYAKEIGCTRIQLDLLLWRKE